MTSNTNATNVNQCPQQAFLQLPPQPYVAPGLAFPDNNNTKFLGVFTASHLSLCLLISGFGLIVTGLLGVVTRASLDQTAFQAVGISLICFGILLIIIAVSIFIFAIRWGRKKVQVMDRPANSQMYNNAPIALLPVQMPVMNGTVSNGTQSNNFESSQNSFNIINANQTNGLNQQFYTIPISQGFMPSGQQYFLVRPSAPPMSPESIFQ